MVNLLAGLLLSIHLHYVGRSHGLALARTLARDTVLFGLAEGLLLNVLSALIGWRFALGLGTGRLDLYYRSTHRSLEKNRNRDRSVEGSQ